MPCHVARVGAVRLELWTKVTVMVDVNCVGIDDDYCVSGPKVSSLHRQLGVSTSCPPLGSGHCIIVQFNKQCVFAGKLQQQMKVVAA